jgi:hypothetical protein
VTEKGIEANPEKVKAITTMSPPRSPKEVRCLAGKMAALNRFISRSAERCLPFFKVLRKTSLFEWSDECQKAFEELKDYLADLSLLTKPGADEPLYLYISVGLVAISTVLV